MVRCGSVWYVRSETITENIVENNVHVVLFVFHLFLRLCGCTQDLCCSVHVRRHLPYTIDLSNTGGMLHVPLPFRDWRVVPLLIKSDSKAIVIHACALLGRHNAHSTTIDRDVVLAVERVPLWPLLVWMSLNLPINDLDVHAFASMTTERESHCSTCSWHSMVHVHMADAVLSQTGNVALRRML